jgi:hypothetical protein
LSFANRLAAWLFPHLEDWIPRRTDFARAFDRFDVLMAVFGTRIGTWGWMPRCAVPRTSTESDDAARATFDETVESWLLRSLGTTTPDEQDLVLREAFHGSSLAERTDAEIFNEIRSWSLPSNWSWMWRR